MLTAYSTGENKTFNGYDFLLLVDCKQISHRSMLISYTVEPNRRLLNPRSVEPCVKNMVPPSLLQVSCLVSGLCQVLFIYYSHLILPKVLWGCFHYNTYFKDKKNSNWERWSHLFKVQRMFKPRYAWLWNPSSLTTIPLFSLQGYTP